jgi:ABC-2 type transport system permease protein
MPHVLQYVSAAIPPRYYIQAMRKLLIMGVGVESVTREIAILAAMASLLLTLALATFHKRLE